ncbi:TatD family hydrolase [Gynuella sunshinyii]|uniref:Mg-dependent DNase n=1 Tax=Gynuella sunshinyii YC6258 TaxID=1445510 RepID=A0A0C5VP75_9GAMM|nr:TatD family hydrolase [Gynuella sunshinyii]AJQ96457.1 Mg-dependent DNase [Gynuella sunshinyii YC6258]
MSKRKPIPILNQAIIETHCHLDYLKNSELETVLEQAFNVGIESIVTIATEPDNLAVVLDIANRFHQVYCTQGIHPHEAEKFTPQTLSTIRDNSHHAKVVAIGEIGLDYYYDHADRAVQRKVFETQLAIASELQLPVVIHTREADDDTLAILKNFSTKLPRKGVIHSFTSGLKLAEFCLSEGFHLGFNGILTFNKAENVREILRATPVTQMLVETDAPYLTPVPYRGVTNEPKYLPFILERMAQEKNIEVGSLTRQLTENARSLFQIN